MAKFCTKCGKPLEDGKACSCVEKEKKEKAVNTKIDIKEYSNLFLEVTKGIIKEPVDTIKKHSKTENLLFGSLAVLLNSILTGILLYCFLKEGTSSMSVITIAPIYEISFIKTFLLGTLFMIVFFGSLSAMIYIMGGILFKSNMDFKKVFTMLGICSIITSLTTILAILFTFISIKFVSFILGIASLFYLVYLCEGIIETSNIRKNSLAYVVVPSLCVAFFIVTYILPKILF